MACAAMMMSAESIAKEHIEPEQDDASTFANAFELCLALWERKWVGKVYSPKHRSSSCVAWSGIDRWAALPSMLELAAEPDLPQVQRYLQL